MASALRVGFGMVLAVSSVALAAQHAPAAGAIFLCEDNGPVSIALVPASASDPRPYRLVLDWQGTARQTISGCLGRGCLRGSAARSGSLHGHFDSRQVRLEFGSLDHPSSLTWVKGDDAAVLRAVEPGTKDLRTFDVYSCEVVASTTEVTTFPAE